METKVVVGVRCRPLSINEKIRGEEPFHYFRNDIGKKAVYTPKNKYPFHHIFTPDASQEEVFLTLAKPLVLKLLEGYNGTIMAYGQTGTGKTYTMGTEMQSGAPPGIVQRVLETLFLTPGITVSLSFIEIYRDEAYDLLSSKPTKLTVVGFRAVNTVIKRLHSIEEARDILQMATKNRRIGSTVANLKSSRSHAIATISVTRRNDDALLLSKLNLVDLAGSEKVPETAGSPRKEGLAINCGLHFLLRVVTCLSEGLTYIPYRDSKLTALLKDSLGSNNYIALVACFNPKQSDTEETEKTFDFASKFGSIELVPEINSHTLTPFKTPVSKFRNQTYCGSSGVFKRPMTPLNRTVASPMMFSAAKRRPESSSGEKIRKLDGFHANPRAREVRESVDSVWSDVSTSTSFSDCRSPENQITVSNMELELKTPPEVSNRQLEAIIKATVAEAIKATEARTAAAVTATVRAQLKEFQYRRENPERWQHRLEKPFDDSLAGVRHEKEGKAEDEESFSASSFETTVLEGKHTGGEDSGQEMFSPATNSDNRTGTVRNRLVFDDAQPSVLTDFTHKSVRRSTRLSLKPRPFQDLTNKGVKQPLEDEGEFRLPQPVSPRDHFEHKLRRRTRLPVSRSDSSADLNIDLDVFKAPRRSTRLSLAPERFTPSKEVAADKKKKSEGNCEVENHQEKILKILQSGDAKELQKLPTVGAKTAMLIINHRSLYGPLNNIEGFKEIRGLTKNQANKFLWANCLE